VTRLTVIGDLVEDIIVRHQGAIASATDNPARIARRRGGSAANVAAAAAGLTPTRFIGRVGDDDAGSTLVASLRASGADVLVQRGGVTGTVVVLVDETGERTMFPDRAAAGELDAIDPVWLDGATIVHVPAYGFGSPQSERVLRDAIAAARRTGARLSIDVSATSMIAAYGVARFQALLADLRPDVLFANADEAALCGLLERTPEPACVWVVKQGPRPALVISSGPQGPSVESVSAVALPSVPDSTGAGDAFAAGYLAASIAGALPVDAAAAGHRSAAAVLHVS
jgi:sugar/nucleoside kinase (ribokinase family)